MVFVRKAKIIRLVFIKIKYQKDIIRLFELFSDLKDAIKIIKFNQLHYLIYQKN